MSRGFNWFKEYEIYLYDEHYKDYAICYLDGDSTSHSSGNIARVQELLENYGGIRIPYVRTREVDENYELDLIDPKVMSYVCGKILDDSIVDRYDMRDRIEWFKKLSDEGYYLSYDLDW